MSIFMAALLLTVTTAVACALPGVFVVLRKNSMLVDAMGHAAFPGIVLGYAVTRALDSPLLIIGAALGGLAVVWGAEALYNTGLITRDASQGLLFPAFFALGVLVVSSEMTTVHLDLHVVLVGDLNLAARERLVVGGYDLGPTYMYVMFAVIGINLLFLLLRFQHMTASTFDADFARLTGLHTRQLGATFAFLVAFTVTASFYAAGALLVLALIVAPAATASLLARRPEHMVSLTLIIAVTSAVVGFCLAYAFNLATSAMLAVFYALTFLVILVVQRFRQSLVRAAL